MIITPPRRASRPLVLLRPLSILAVVSAVALLFTTLAPAASAARDSGSAASSPCAPVRSTASSRSGSIGGIVRPLGTPHGCATPRTVAEAAYGGQPPLLNHGGPVMSTPAVSNKVVVTPIYWAPSGFSFSASYKQVINGYLSALAADSGKSTNVFASLTQYPGNNGNITYGIVAGTALTDTHRYPASGCTVNSGSVYSDGSGYSTCLDDAQLVAETNNVVSAHGLVSDLGHMYLMFTPKGVESCFSPGNPSNQACTINPSPSAAFCAYHSYFGSTSAPTVYANMPFPIYQSATGFSCTVENFGGGIQSPNGNVDADVEVSPLSHEMAEAITDPELNSWYDSSGNENGDDCAYIYGAKSGAAGAFYNQTISGQHYLTQEEFSNRDFVPNISGCIQQVVSSGPAVTAVSPNSGPVAGGQTVTITGTGFTGATKVKFGAALATSFTVVSSTTITAHTPAHAAGRVNVIVIAPSGKSAAVPGDRYTYA